MKKISAIVFIASIIASTFFFQNCGGPESSFKADFDANSASGAKGYRDDYAIDAVTGESVSLEVPENNFTAFYLDNGVCVWTYTNASRVSKEFKNPETSYSLPQILKKQAGIYTMTCTNNTLTHSYVFTVTVTDPPQIDGVPAGPYKLYYVVSGVETLNASAPLVTEADAKARCVTGTAAAPQAYGIKCMWGATVFSTRGENVPPPRALGKIYFISGGKSQEVGSRPNITRAEAVNLCKETADNGKYKSYGMKCVWGSEIIFTR